MPSPHPTIVDLARETGLSKTTVSDALAGRGRVSDATRQRVTSAATRLGYRHNRAAQRLRSSATGAIGLYIPPTVRPFAFYMDLAFGATEAATALGSDLLLVARDPALIADRPPHVDGVVVVDPPEDDPITRGFLAAGVPLVSIGRLHPGYTGRARGTMRADYRSVVLEIADRLADEFEGDVAFLGPGPDFTTDSLGDMYAGYLEHRTRRSLEPIAAFVPLRADNTLLRRAATDLLANEGVRVLIGGAQGFAARVIPTIEALGHTVGRDFAVATAVSDPAADSWIRSMTAVDTRPHAFGVDVVGLLGEVLRGEHDPAVTVERTHRVEVRWADRIPD